MISLSFNSTSIRAKLALILGFTIFALAATRALGLIQLDGFLERFKEHTDRMETVRLATFEAHRAEQGLARQIIAIQPLLAAPAGAEESRQKAFQQTEDALARLESLAASAGLDTQPVKTLRAAHRDAQGLAADAPLAQARLLALEKLTELLTSRAGMLRKEAESARSVETVILNRTYFSMLILVLGAGIIAYWLIVKMITRPLARVAQVADTVARGDLRSDVRPESTDELGRVMSSLRDMNRGLADLIGDVRRVSGAISGCSDGIAAISAESAGRMSSQSSALTQMAATMGDLSSGIGRTAQNARLASERAAGASSIAVKGGEVVSRVTATMNEIDASARRITEVIAVIDGMAFQTNLLALNAAVEAARAGEQGRGFAVVAAEVRRLAQKSTEAAQEVRTLIEDSLAKVSQGASAVREAGDTMSKIVENARDVTLIVEEIATLAAAQARGVQEVNRAVGAMDQSNRHNSVLVERAVGAASKMREQAFVLNDAVSIFRLAERG